MKISECIAQLAKLQEESGDVEVGYRQEGYLNRFHWPQGIKIERVTEYKESVPVAIFIERGHLPRALSSIRKLAGFAERLH